MHFPRCIACCLLLLPHCVRSSLWDWVRFLLMSFSKRHCPSPQMRTQFPFPILDSLPHIKLDHSRGILKVRLTGLLQEIFWLRLPSQIYLSFRCTQASGPCGCLYLGRESSEHHLWGICIPQCCHLLVPGWTAASQLKLQQHQDLQHSISKLPGGEEEQGGEKAYAARKARCCQIIYVPDVEGVKSFNRALCW